MPISVFLLDDHELVREGIRTLLESDADIEVVGEASYGRRGAHRIPLAKPDVAILDVRLEDGDGIEVCRDVRSALPDLVCSDADQFRRRRGALRQRYGRSGGLRPQADRVAVT